MAIQVLYIILKTHDNKEQCVGVHGKEIDRNIDVFHETFWSSWKNVGSMAEQFSRAYRLSSVYDLTLVSPYFQSLMFGSLPNSSESDIHDGVEKHYDNL